MLMRASLQTLRVEGMGFRAAGGGLAKAGGIELTALKSSAAGCSQPRRSLRAPAPRTDGGTVNLLTRSRISGARRTPCMAMAALLDANSGRSPRLLSHLVRDQADRVSHARTQALPLHMHPHRGHLAGALDQEGQLDRHLARALWAASPFYSSTLLPVFRIIGRRAGLAERDAAFAIGPASGLVALAGKRHL